jgi:menaquinone-dependent protoporphyrinogen oxidase
MTCKGGASERSEGLLEMKILVAYASKHGSTEGIAEAIADRLREKGDDATAIDVTDVADLHGIDAVVLGSAVYAGSWRDEAVEFAHRNREALAVMPIWLFSSGPLGEQVVDDEKQPKQLAQLSTELEPRDHRVFFGALDKSKLSFGERMMVKAVRAPDGDYRDWDAIRAWADEIAASLAGR